MTREYLLKTSIADYKDNVNNCTVWETDRHFTKSGYCYVIKKNPRSISAALHYNASFETDENIGKYENNDIHINTREQLPLDAILTYKHLTFAISSQGNYNETMKQWHYDAQGVYKPLESFVITDEAAIIEQIGCNSMAALMSLEDVWLYPVVPSYYSAESLEKYIMLSVDSTEAVTPVYRTYEIDNNLTSKILRFNKDSVKFSFVNMTTIEALKQVEALQLASTKPTSPFGINQVGSLRDENIYQKSFNFKSLTYALTMDVNYYLYSLEELERKRIIDVFVKHICYI